MHVSTTTLPSGLRVVTEKIADIRSVAIGCWVDTGTRDERPNEAGASHFLEHLLFKGSERMPARYISETFDAIGAQSNAFTSKEYTCFWARLVDTEIGIGTELLAEMLQRPAFRVNEIDSERNVVIEEINMNEDDPSDVAVEAFFTALFADHPLERPVLGTRTSITEMTPEDIAGYWKRRYGTGSTVVAIAGNVEHEQAVELVMDQFGDWTPEAEGGHQKETPTFSSLVNVVSRDTEQAHLVIGGDSIDRTDEGRYADTVMHHILGGGMSSRLFQTIREERGLAYAVQSFSMPFAETGAWAVYVGTTPANAHTVLDLVLQEVEGMATSGVTEEELERAKGHMRGSLALSMEDTNTRMTRLGRAEVFGLPHLSLDERLAKVEAITADDVQKIAGTVLAGPKALGAVGPFEAADLERHVA
jgi:predicted Zn-dependent peptidase